jgi:hypothetical protein
MHVDYEGMLEGDELFALYTVNGELLSYDPATDLYYNIDDVKFWFDSQKPPGAGFTIKRIPKEDLWKLK